MKDHVARVTHGVSDLKRSLRVLIDGVPRILTHIVSNLSIKSVV